MHNQLLLPFFLGNLTPRHREVFLRNPLFVGMRIPEVREIQPLERKFTKVSPEALDFMKVWQLYFYFCISSIMCSLMRELDLDCPGFDWQ
jgi:hypothetical protein